MNLKRKGKSSRVKSGDNPGDASGHAPEHSIPPQPGDIASTKPKDDKPWCLNCRAHTHYTTKKVTRTSTDEDGATTKRTENLYRCRHCKDSMLVPSEAKTASCFIGCCGGVFGCFLALIGMSTFFNVNLNETSPSTSLIPLMFWAAFTYGFWRLYGYLSGYRNWLEWAKSHEDKEAK